MLSRNGRLRNDHVDEVAVIQASLVAAETSNSTLMGFHHLHCHDRLAGLDDATGNDVYLSHLSAKGRS